MPKVRIAHRLQGQREELQNAAPDRLAGQFERDALLLIAPRASDGSAYPQCTLRTAWPGRKRLGGCAAADGNDDAHRWGVPAGKLVPALAAVAAHVDAPFRFERDMRNL
jgi:hypothetical protein